MKHDNPGPDNDKPVTIAIVNGEKVEYDACSFERYADNGEEIFGQREYEYIGQGRIYSIGTFPFKSNAKYHFWRLKDKPRRAIKG
jgi:hypothetical protein